MNHSTNIMDTFNNEPQFADFMSSHMTEITELMRSFGIYAIMGDPSAPPIILGFIEGDDEPTMQYNINAILSQLIARYGDRLLSSGDAFDECFNEYMVALISSANDILKNRNSGDTWGTENERFENVHDTSVNIGYRNSYIKIKAENSKTDTQYYISNIRSYFYFKTNMLNINLANVNILNMNVKSFMDAIHKVPIDESIKILRDFEKCIINTIKFIDDVPMQIQRLKTVMRVIAYIEKNNETMVSVNDTELNVLLNVWKRIHSDANVENAEVLLGLLESELISLENPNRPDEIECVNGRIGAMLSSLTVYDADNIVDIKSVPALKVQLVQHRTPVIISEFLKNCDTDTVHAYNTGEENSKTLALKQDLSDYLTTKLTEEFSSQLSPYHLNRFILEVVQEL